MEIVPSTGSLSQLAAKSVPHGLRPCNRCGRELPETEFHRDKALRGGQRYTCKLCATEAARVSRQRRNESTDGLGSIWVGMKKRCFNPRHHSFPRYGGRGITVCEAWLNDFGRFQRWAVENGYQRGLQLDRRDNDGPYDPSNCRWVTRRLNMRNRSNTKLNDDAVRSLRALLQAGVMHLEAAARFGVDPSTVSNVARGKTWKDVR